MEEQIVHLCELVKQNKLNEVANVLLSINADEVLCSSDHISSSLIYLEQNACQLLKNCLKSATEYDQDSLKYIEHMG